MKHLTAGEYIAAQQEQIDRLQAELEEKEGTMNPNEYQKLASRTLIDKPGFDISDNDMMIIWNALGLAGEAGECVDTIKKGILHQHGLDKRKMFKELGDVLWYVAALCTKLGFSLEDVMQANIDKLKERYPDGYSSENSKVRVDVQEVLR